MFCSSVLVSRRRIVVALVSVLNAPSVADCSLLFRRLGGRVGSSLTYPASRRRDDDIDRALSILFRFFVDKFVASAALLALKNKTKLSSRY